MSNVTVRRWQARCSPSCSVSCLFISLSTRSRNERHSANDSSPASSLRGSSTPYLAAKERICRSDRTAKNRLRSPLGRERPHRHPDHPSASPACQTRLGTRNLTPSTGAIPINFRALATVVFPVGESSSHAHQARPRLSRFRARFRASLSNCRLSIKCN
jgi:hypothetical protein